MIINKYTIISYYNFTEIKNIFKCKNFFNKAVKNLDLKGIILIAPEGVNLNVSIISAQKDLFLSSLSNFFSFSHNDLKLSYENEHIFRKIKIKIKREILTTRLNNEINPVKSVGEYIKPKDWDNFIRESYMENSRFIEGFLVAILNPKIAVFFISLFSQFLVPGQSIAVHSVMALMAGGIDTFVYCGIVFLASTKKVSELLTIYQREVGILFGILLGFLALSLFFSLIF